MKRTLLFATAFATAWLVSTALAETGNELFQKALVKERSEGNLKEAIKLYQQVVDKYGKDRALAAKALVAIGESQEKLGETEARKTYERIVRDYGDQKEALALARAKLGGIDRTSAQSGIITRQVWADALDGEGGPSPDARYLSFVDWTTGDLAVRDLISGENRRLTNKGTWEESEEFALFSVFAPDGKQIAYSWFNGGKDHSWDIRVISMEGSGIPKARVLHHDDGVEALLPFDWSKDGKQLLALVSRNDLTQQAALISTADGSTRVLRTFDWRSPTKLSLSPDGRYIAYDFPPQEDSPLRDIFILATDGSRESAVVVHAANDLAPVWTPDGKSILFLSDRTGSMGAWTIPIADGKAQGNPELIKADVGQMGPMGFTRKGSLFYALQIGNSHVYTAALDLAGGALREPKSITEPYSGQNMSPDWSPDGQFLAYVSTRSFAREPGSTVICVRKLDTGEQRELRPALSYFQSIRWAPNGKTLVAWGSDRKGRKGIFEIDAVTGALKPIVDTGEDFRGAIWSPDGQSLYYYDYHDGRLLVRDRATGRERELLPARRLNIGRLSLSPDGRRLAMVAVHPETKSQSIVVVPANGGEPREILSLPTDMRVVEWMPDSNHIVFTRARPSTVELWRIAAESGEPERIAQGPTMASIRNLRFNTDGSRVAFNAGNTKAEIWVMENFLPTSKVSK